MADKKISQLTGASTPLAGTEVLPIVQSGSTVKVASDDLTVKNVRSNATTGILQVAGPGAGATRTMTVPDANFTAARTDAGQTFSGSQTFGGGVNVTGGKVQSVYGAGGDFVALFQNTTSATPYGVWIKDAATPAAGYPLLNISSSDGMTVYMRVDSDNGNAYIGKGNVAFSTAGKGIDFSANTHAAGMTSELLNWYEEGTWTPSVRGETGGAWAGQTGTFSGKYTRIGRMVTCNFSIALTATGSVAGNYAVIAGLPFTVGSPSGNAIISYWGPLTSNWTNIVGLAASSIIYLYGRKTAGTSQDVVFVSEITATTELVGTAIYFV